MTEWNPISTAPRDGTKIDVWMMRGPTDTLPQYRETDVYWSDVQDGWCVDGEYGPEEPQLLTVYPYPSHWMPRPLPPKQEANDEAR